MVPRSLRLIIVWETWAGSQTHLTVNCENKLCGTLHKIHKQSPWILSRHLVWHFVFTCCKGSNWARMWHYTMPVFSGAFINFCRIQTFVRKESCVLTVWIECSRQVAMQRCLQINRLKRCFWEETVPSPCHTNKTYETHSCNSIFQELEHMKELPTNSFCNAEKIGFGSNTVTVESYCPHETGLWFTICC